MPPCDSSVHLRGSVLHLIRIVFLAELGVGLTQPVERACELVLKDKLIARRSLVLLGKDLLGIFEQDPSREVSLWRDPSGGWQ